MNLKLLFKSYFVSFLCVLFTLPVLAQSKVITGKVSDSKDSSGVVGASVTIKGSKNGVQTSADGSFTITVPGTATALVVSSVGYNQQEVPIAGQTTLEVSLVASNAALNEVVVVGYGQVRKRDVTGSVTSVKAKDFNQGVITSPDQLLQGKVPGLEITSNSGQPGAATTIKIRGNNSIRANNNPLYVVDGVPLDGRTARPSLNLGQNGLGFGPTPESNPLLYINPNDIAQVDVLKDASAAAIYGSRGANGVIVITTKKGSNGGPKLEFATNFGVAAGYMKKHEVLSAAEFRAANDKYSLKFDSGASVDPLKEITQSRLTQNYSLGVSGGNENGKYRVSLLGSSTEGFIKKTSLDKYLANISGQYKFIDQKLSVDFNLIAGHTTENMGLISNTAGAGGNLMSWALNWNPTTAFKASNGLYNLTSNSIPNPLAAIDATNDVADVNVFLANIAGSYKLNKDLEYKFLYAINHGAGSRNSSIDGWLGGVQGVSGTGIAAISKAMLTSQTFTHTLSYNHRLSEKFNLNAVAGYEYWKTNYSSSSLFASQFNVNLDQANRIPILYTSIFQNAKTQFPLTTVVDPTVEIQSVFARVIVNMLDKYIITGTIRGDGSNKFGRNNRYGYFPSVGVKWALSNEEFMKSSDLFSNLAVRASWGITGNQEFPAGAALEQFTSGGYNSVGQSNVANPDLKWEKTTAYNFGLEYALFKNRITGTFDYYNKNTTDLLFQSTAIQPAPASIFFINLPANLINSGVEFSINAGIVDKPKFSWDAGFNIAYNKNMLKKFSQAAIPTGQVNGNGVSGALAQVITNNQPVNEFYLKPFNGFDQTGQQIIGDAPVYAGDPNPHLIFGFNTNLRFRKLSLAINGSGASGYMIYNNTYNTITNISQLQKGQNIWADALKTNESINDGVAASTRYLEKGDYFKLRNATLNYAFGTVGNYIKNLNVFVGATNLFVITKFSGFDPEVNVDKSNNNYPSRSMEYIPYPTPRVITFGFNLGL